MNSETPTLLLLEGDIIARSPLAQYLRECGFIVIEAANGDEARLALRVPELKIEAVLADMNTRGSGFDFKSWVQAEGLDVKVILAGSTDMAIDKAGSLCNNGPALAKPYQHHLVRDQVRQAIARRERTLQTNASSS